METKSGLYLVIGFTILFVAIVIYSLTTGRKMSLSGVGLMIITLATMWSGVNVKNNLTTRKNKES